MFSAIVLALLSWHIANFDVSGRLNEKGELSILETITVDFGKSKFHGIFRDIPMNFRGHPIGFQLVSVSDGNGNPIRYETKKMLNQVRIKIGDPQRYVTGIQKYVIFYKVKHVVFETSGVKRLVWNVTGNSWPVEIEHASFRFTFEGEPNAMLDAECYTGRYGSTQSFCNVRHSGNYLQSETTQPLSMMEGFTVSVDFKPDAIAAPGFFVKVWWFVQKFWMWSLPIVAFFYMFSLWWRKGREKDIGPIAPFYEPPKDLNPIEAGALIDERVDSSDVTAQLLQLAFRGYISIKETPDGKDFVIEELNRNWIDDPKFKQYERVLLSELFSKGNLEPIRKKARKKPEFAKFLAEIDSSGHRAVAVSSLKNKFYQAFKKIRMKVMEELTRRGYFVKNPEKVKAFYTGIAIAVLFVGHFTGILLTILQNNPWQMQLSFASLLAAAVVFGFGRAMPKRTRRGVQALRQLRGFLEFIRRAEKDRIRRLAEEDFMKFKDVLAYAVAFREEDKWSEVFEEMYERLEPSGMRTVAITNLSTMNSFVGSSLASSPRGSGSGGGFSGGGAGGGGGGAW